tara:strand:- start:1222 stop:5109 length:3888 start_codon:yes stop_codon:yes gene_type:complete
MPTYDFLEPISFDVNAGGLTPAGYSDALSAWTNELTKQQFKVNTATLPAEVVNNKFVFDWGDGNTSKVNTFSAEHVYNYPGIYTVTLRGYTSAGKTVLSTTSLSVTAGDFISNRLENKTLLRNGVWIAKAGDKNNEITIDRFNTWQDTEAYLLGRPSLTITLSGSDSEHIDPRDKTKHKWSHVTSTWSTYSRITADNGSLVYTELDNLSSTNDNLYYKKDDSGNYVRCLSSDTNSVFVGTSGTYTIFFRDDIAKAKDNFLPVILYATPNRKGMPEPEDLVRGNLGPTDDAYTLGRLKPIQIPVSVRFNTGQSLAFTPTGIAEITYPGQKWERVESPFVISVRDIDNQNLLTFPKLNLSSTTVAAYNNLSDSNLELNKVYLTFAKTAEATLSASVHPNTDDNLDASLNGFYRGSFIPYESTTDPVTANFKARINNEAFFDADISFGVVGRSVAVSGDDQQSAVQLVPRVIMSTDIETGGEKIVTGQINTFSVSAQSLTGEQFATAVAPESGSGTAKRCYISDVRNDVINIINQDAGEFTSLSGSPVKNPINLRNISILDDGTNLDLITYSRNKLSAANSFTTMASGTHLLVIPDAANDNNTEIDNVIDRNGITSLSIDGQYNLWIALHDTNLIARYNTTSEKIDRLVLGRDNSDTVTYDLSSYHALVSLSGFGGFNPEEPYVIDADKNDNIWVAYSNPLCASLKYFEVNKSSNQVTLTREIPFPSGVTITDMAVDSDNKVWFSTYDQLRSGATHTGVLSASVDTTTNSFKFEAGGSVLAAVSGEIEVDKIFIARGFFYGAKPFNGGYIIKSVADDKSSWTVHTHPDDISNLPDSATAYYDVQFQFANSDFVGYATNTSSTIAQKVSGFYNPSHIAFDNGKNVFVTHDVSTVEQVVDTTWQKGLRFLVESDISPAAQPIDYETKQYLTGLGSDFSNRLWVINNHKRTLTFLPTRSIGLSSVEVIPNSVDNEYYQSVGDWTGYRWYNKYANLGSTNVLSGAVTFTVNPTGGLYQLRKVEEDFDPSETIKSYRQQEFLKDYDKFFDDFMGSIVGTADSDPNELGNKIYEKIANFVGNHTDPETCNIEKLESIAKSVNHKLNEYRYTYPTGIKRAMDLLSINHSRLWGNQSKFDRNFTTRNATLTGVNLGVQLSVESYIVSAGTPVIINQLFNNEYRKVNTMHVSLTPELTANAVYDNDTQLYSQYPLSAYDSSWGWGIRTDLSGLAITGYNNFYEFTEKYNDTVLDSVIDWTNTNTTLTRSNSSMAAWEDDEGIIDLILEQEIRKGLGLFQDTVSATSV